MNRVKSGQGNLGTVPAPASAAKSLPIRGMRVKARCVSKQCDIRRLFVGDTPQRFHNFAPINYELLAEGSNFFQAVILEIVMLLVMHFRERIVCFVDDCDGSLDLPSRRHHFVDRHGRWKNVEFNFIERTSNIAKEVGRGQKHGHIVLSQWPRHSSKLPIDLKSIVVSERENRLRNYFFIANFVRLCFAPTPICHANRGRKRKHSSDCTEPRRKIADFVLIDSARGSRKNFEYHHNRGDAEDSNKNSIEPRDFTFHLSPIFCGAILA